MDFLNKLDNNSILIIPNNVKDKVLDYIDKNNTLFNIKIMTFFDLKKGLLFDYTNEAIYYVMKKQQINYGVAKDFLNNLYYINEGFYEHKKLKDLLNLKHDLLNNNLLIKDSLFESLLKSKKKIYVYGFDYITKFNKYLLNLASKFINIEYIDKERKNYIHEVRELNSLEDEVFFVAEEISKLINKGVDINKIYLANYTDEYYFTIKRIFKMFNLPIYLKGNTSLYTTVIGKYFLDNLSNNLDLLLYKIRAHFDLTIPENELVYNKLCNLANTYYWCEDISVLKNLISEEMKHIKINPLHQTKEIKMVNIIDNYFEDDEYVFLIGFNLGILPRVVNDEDYINDDIKPSIIETSFELNRENKQALINALANIKNLSISYKKMSAFSSYEPSYLINELGIIVQKIKLDYSNYSHEFNKLKLAKQVDNLVKFNENNESIAILNNNYSINYNTYSSHFTGVENSNLINKIDDNLVFSATNITSYDECPFGFYVKYILRVGKFEETLDQLIGNVFHYCLENCLEDDTKDVDTLYDEYIENIKQEKDFTNKEKFFIRALKKEIHFVVATIKEQYRHSKHNITWKEKEIQFDLDRKIKTKIKGFVDKILLLDNAAIIIDYKTGNSATIDKRLFEYGLSIQLPIYLYLLKELDSNIDVAGLYIQHILDLKYDYDPKNDPEKQKKDNLKLVGITFDNVDLIKNFDDSYEKSQVIKGLRINSKTGNLYKNNYLMDLEEKAELISLVENIIFNCIDNVSDGKFDIVPKISSKREIHSCKFCEYKDICYRKPSDFKYINLDSKGRDNDE